MQFKHPEILYALLLLLIPILIHLFQFRKFKKTPFTNVAFLQKLIKNTRKSSTLKKWLILTTRLLGLAALIFAFAEPFLPKSQQALLPREAVVFIDNSYSMQAKGSIGSLLSEAKQQVLQHWPEDQPFTLITYTDVYQNITVSDIHNDILNINYTPFPLNTEALLLRAKRFFSKKTSTIKDFVVLSDFQNIDQVKLDDSQLNQHWIQLSANTLENYGIDSLALAREGKNYNLKVFGSSNTTSSAAQPIALYNGEQLVTKGTLNFTENKKASVQFKISNKNVFRGKLVLKDAHLLFDNELYFTINKSNPVRILGINNAPDNYLERLFPEPDYKYTSVKEEKFDYSILYEQDVIILNELKSIPTALINALQMVSQNGGKIVFIPNNDGKRKEYSDLFAKYELPPLGTKSSIQKRITTINYDHPLYKGVFTKRVNNLQYHTAANSYPLSSSDVILRMEDGNAFLAQANGLYAFTASLQSDNSNFKNGELIVPTFDKIAQQARSIPQAYYFLTTTEPIDIEAKTTTEDPIKLKKDDLVVIPLQEKQGDRIRIINNKKLSQSGIYNIISQNKTHSSIAYNYSREEGNLNLVSLQPNTAILNKNIENVVTSINEESDLNTLYKWFVIFAIAMLLAEMLILKFIK